MLGESLLKLKINLISSTLRQVLLFCNISLKTVSACYKSEVYKVKSSTNTVKSCSE